MKSSYGLEAQKMRARGEILNKPLRAVAPT